MPIKFRCQHCQQLLGISRSRASAVVDCPQCGRSLRVPELDGRTRKMPNPRSSASSDAALALALSELSALNDLPADGSAPPVETTTGTDRRVISVAPATNLQPVEPSPVAPSQVIDAGVVDASGIGEEPVAIEESLEELAAYGEAPETGHVSPDLLQEMHRARHGDGRSFTIIAMTILSLALGAAGGWFAREAVQGSGDFPDARTNGGDTATEASRNARKTAPNITNTVDSSLHGQVIWSAADGQPVPDAGATVVLLPAKRKGALKLNARSLLREGDDPDRAATIAALTALGGAMTEADATGRFRLPVTAASPVTVIAVSKNKERPNDVPAPAVIVQLLEDYFDSTSHILGRRSVQALTIPSPSNETSSLTFQFSDQR